MNGGQTVRWSRSDPQGSGRSLGPSALRRSGSDPGDAAACRKVWSHRPGLTGRRRLARPIDAFPDFLAAMRSPRVELCRSRRSRTQPPLEQALDSAICRLTPNALFAGLRNGAMIEPVIRNFRVLEVRPCPPPGPSGKAISGFRSSRSRSSSSPRPRRREKIAFRQIHEPTGKPIHYQKVVAGVGPVDTDDILQGLRVREGRLRPPRPTRRSTR